MSRQGYINNIADNIAKASDTTVSEIYKKVCDMCDDEKKDDIKRAQKIKYILANLDLVGDDDLSEINDTIDNIHHYELMYNCFLEILNELLEHLGQNKIKVITHFKDISRDSLLTDECEQILLNKGDVIVENGFKKDNGFLKYKKLKFGHINIIKGMCKQLGYKLITEKHSKTVDGERVYIQYYSIKRE